jgi:hypothetical protein
MKNEPSADATPSINPTNKAVGSKRNISTLDGSMAKLEDNSENNVKEDEILTSQPTFRKQLFDVITILQEYPL